MLQSPPARPRSDSRHRAGRGFRPSSTASPANGTSPAASTTLNPASRLRSRRSRRRSRLPRRASRPSSAISPHRRNPHLRNRPAGRIRIPHRTQHPLSDRQHPHRTRHRYLQRLPPRTPFAQRPPLPLSLPQLHQLRPALYHHPLSPLRPQPDLHGRLPHVPAMPGRIRRPAQPPLPRPA